METDGEGVGGEADRRGRSELGRLLEAIESSEVLEKRIPLIKQLEGSSHFSADGLGAILECLLASWVDSTCSGVSHCTLHRSILQVALKCTDMDITDYLGQFLTLGAKASSWCGKHLLWSVGCIDESEHDGLHLEINSLSLSISTKLLGVAAKYFTVLQGLEVAAGGGGKGAAEEEEELEWLSNKDAFPSVEAVAVEVEEASASPLDAPRASTKGRRRVTANESSRQAKEMAMPPVRRCTHCATEETPQWRWREGPDGPRTLCNACGLVFKKKGRLLPEYRPAKSSASSPLLHSSTHRHRRAFEMHHQNETTSAACHGEARSELVEGQLLPPPNGPASSYRLQRHCPLRHQNEVDTSAAGRAIVEAGRGEARLRLESMEVQLRPERPPAFSQLQRHSPHRQERRQSEETSAVDRATTETRRGESRFESMEVQPLPERPPAYIPAFSLVPHRFVLKRRRQSEEEETSAAGRDTVEARRGEARLRLESMEVQLRRERPPAFSQLQRYSPLHQERRQSEETSAVDRATTEARRDEARFESMEVQPLPERPPAYSPAFSLVPHRFVLKRRRKSEEEETSAAGRATAEARLRLESMEVQLRPERPPAFSQLQHYSPLRQERRQREEETSATGHATTEARRGEESVKAQLLPERPPAYSSAFSLVPHRLVPKRHHQSEEETFAVIHATAKALRAERAAAMDD